MAKFTVEINCDNAAFDSDENRDNELVILLEAITNCIRFYGAETAKTKLFDSNGNKVGQFTFEK